MDSFGAVSKQVRKSQRSVKNRLHSIHHDSQFVLEVQEAFGRPLVPNERCGLWYVPPDYIKETSYFKSTDGHTNQWSFSTKRLNFHLLDLLVRSQGIVIVDSTRRGKTMPDALSKTVPIWCATINYILYGSDHEQNWVFWSKQIISENEANSIIKLIPSFAKTVQDLGLLDQDKFKLHLKGKYLRPIWVHPGMSLPFERPEYEDFIPLICCVASERADDGMKKMKGFTYVQGAADDHELWAGKLDPGLFWANADVLLAENANDECLLQIIDELKLEKNDSTVIEGLTQLTPKLCVGKVTKNINARNDTDDFDTIVLLSDKFKFVNDEKIDKSLRHYTFPSNKKGSNELRKVLPEIMKLITTGKDEKSLILCENGTDLSIGVALVVLATNYNTQWEEESGLLVTKDVIRKHLAKVLQVKKVNPSRATLQSINSFLM